MKKQTTLMSMIMALALLISLSCNKSSTEDGPDIPSEMVANGFTYLLAKGLIIDWQQVNNAAADIDLALMTIGININDEGQPINRGSMIYFDLNSFDSNQFETGTYEFGLERGPGIITGGSLILDYNGDPNGTPPTAFINEGELRVSETDGIYEVHFDVTTVDGDQVTGSYVGRLTLRTND